MCGEGEGGETQAAGAGMQEQLQRQHPAPQQQPEDRVEEQKAQGGATNRHGKEDGVVRGEEGGGAQAVGVGVGGVQEQALQQQQQQALQQQQQSSSVQGDSEGMGETVGPCGVSSGVVAPDPSTLPANYKLVWKLLAAR